MIKVAEKMIKKFGGHQALADVLGINISWVYRFTYPEDKGGTGGRIPSKHQIRLLQVAPEKGIELSPSEFFEIETIKNKKPTRKRS